MRSKAKLYLLLLFAAVAVLPLHSAVVKLLYLDDIASQSAVIVQGTILSGSAAWNASHTKIITTYQVKATRYVKGDLGDVFQFQEPGGVVDNVGMVATGTPVFDAGEQVVLMLWSDGSGTRYECIGLGQGVLRVHTENGVPMVDHAIPVRAGQFSPAMALTPFATATSKQLSIVMVQLGLAATQAELMQQQTQREAR